MQNTNLIIRIMINFLLAYSEVRAAQIYKTAALCVR
jgi:hypothetical protein